MKIQWRRPPKLGSSDELDLAPILLAYQLRVFALLMDRFSEENGKAEIWRQWKQRIVKANPMMPASELNALIEEVNASGLTDRDLNTMDSLRVRFLYLQMTENWDAQIRKAEMDERARVYEARENADRATAPELWEDGYTTPQRSIEMRAIHHQIIADAVEAILLPDGEITDTAELNRFFAGFGDLELQQIAGELKRRQEASQQVLFPGQSNRDRDSAGCGLAEVA